MIYQPTERSGNHERSFPTISCSIRLCDLPFGIDECPGLTQSGHGEVPARLKTAVLNGSITGPQVKQLQADAETLKKARSEQSPEAPVDLLTPWRAVSSMKTIMATVDTKDRETLRQDLQAVIASKQQRAPDAPTSPGQKLGKDIFKAVMMGDPTEAQVQQLQDSLNSLKAAKGNQGHPLQALRALNSSKLQIESVIKAEQFRPEDQQAVLNDLNSLGPHGGGTRQ
jgi:hypothetical protein